MFGCNLSGAKFTKSRHYQSSDELIELESGIQIPTIQYPSNRFVQVKLLCVVGDVLATKKAAGFAAHNATYFCSWCLAKSVNLASLQLGPPRKKDPTISTAKKMTTAKSSYAQEELLKKIWSPMVRS
jgi:hypothetical protein